ncbi:MAG: peptidoglycan D,D-transpeptidase FtsI family protein [Phycisphaerae bacterium]
MNILPRTWRINFVLGLAALALVGLVGYMGFLLRTARERAARLEETQARITVPLPARRGTIYAMANTAAVPMAGSRQVPSCFIDLDPKVIRDDELGDVAIKVGQALGGEDYDPEVAPVKLNMKFLARRGSRFVWLKHDLSKQELEAILAVRKKNNLRCIGIAYEEKRDYFNGKLASVLVGWRGPNGDPGGGVEYSQDRALAPRDGVKVMKADAARHPLEEVPEEKRLPVDGGQVYLTIDTNIQRILEDAVSGAVDKFKAKWGVGAVVNPNTGAVLAMASVWLDPRAKTPLTFDPNSFGTAPADVRANRAITVPYEPGSAGKTIFAAWAVSNGIVDWDTQIFCENGIYHSPRGGTISDHGAHYGWLTIRDIIAQSSNIGMGKVGEKCGNALLYKGATAFGFGRRTGIELPGESPGILRGQSRWDTYSTIRVPFGQEISVTCLQLTMAYAALANGGKLMKPHIVDHITDASGKETYRSRPEVVRTVIKPSVAASAVLAMQDVVERGTGKRTPSGGAQSDKYWLFGKTGTAQIPSSTPGHPGYVDGAFTGTFVGGGPVSKPQVVCCISIHWPNRSLGHFGATVAAPAFRDVMEKTLMYLNVPPDKGAETAAAPAGDRAVALAD